MIELRNRVKKITYTVITLDAADSNLSITAGLKKYELFTKTLKDNSNILNKKNPKYEKNCPYAKKCGLRHSLILFKLQLSCCSDIAILFSSG